MARHATRKEKAMFRDLQAEVARFRESPEGKAIRSEAAAAVAKHDSLLTGLRNVNRTTTRALDEAGVPDELQGAGEADWDAADQEEWGH